MMKQRYLSRPLFVPLLATMAVVLFIFVSLNWGKVSDYYLARTLEPTIERTYGFTAHYVHLKPAIPWPSDDVVAIQTVRPGSVSEKAGFTAGDIPLHPYTLWPGTDLGAFYKTINDAAPIPPLGLPVLNINQLDSRWREHVRYVRLSEQSSKTGT
jgi:hypothetical protein